MLETRRNNFDFLRFVLAVAVILSHCYPLLRGDNATEPFFRFSRGQITIGTAAVDLFFVLSGFLITQSWVQRPSLTRFLGKRVRRIYPGYMVAVLLCAVVVGPLSLQSPAQAFDRAQAPRLLASMIALRPYNLPGCFSSNPYPNAINGSLWSISYEFICYLGIATLGMVGLLYKRRFVAGLFAVVCIVSFVLTAGEMLPQGGVFARVFGEPLLWARLLPCYLAGTAAFLFRDKIRYDARFALLALAIIVVASQIPPALILVFPAAAAYLLFFVGLHPRLPLHNFGKHGDFSYGIYLYAFPIQQLLVQQLGSGFHPLALFLIAGPLSILAGAASWRLVERWALPPARVPAHS